MWSKDISLLNNFTFEIAAAFFKEHGTLSSHNSRAYKFFSEGYIHDLWFNPEDLILKAKSYHSQKKNEKPHSLLMYFKMNPILITECHCSCEVGLSQSCHHLIGLAFYLQDVILRGKLELEEPAASTSKPMEWNKPRGTKVFPENVMSVTFHKPTKLRRKKNPVSYKLLNPKMSIRNGTNRLERDKQTKLICLKKQLERINEEIPLSYLIDTNNTDDDMTILGLQKNKDENLVANSLPVDLPILDGNCINILISLPLPEMDKFHNFTFKDSKDLEIKTRHQNSSKEWHQNRRFIFTSSSFGMLCKRQKPVDEVFFEKLWEEKNLENVKAIQHGRKEEKNARDLYEKHTGYKVFLCGLIIHPYAPYLGTSPDGIVTTGFEGTGLVEFKCPYGSKSGTLKDALKVKNFHIKEDENKKYVINTNHDYYYQIQGQMLLSGIKWCDLCTYFKKNNETCIVRVEFDDIFCREMFETLTLMYNVYLNL